MVEQRTMATRHLPPLASGPHRNDEGDGRDEGSWGARQTGERQEPEPAPQDRYYPFSMGKLWLLLQSCQEPS